MFFTNKASAQIAAENNIYLGGISRYMNMACYQFPDGTVIGEESSIFKGGDSNDALMGCEPDVILSVDGKTVDGLYKGGSATIVILDCIEPMRLSDGETTPYTGGGNYGDAVYCGMPVQLTPDGETVGIYKGGASNDYYVNCLEKPAIIDVDLPMYQGGRSYMEILSCSNMLLGEGTLFVGGASRVMAISCFELESAGGSMFNGDSSRIMLTETACHTLEESLTGENFYGGGESVGIAEDCIDDVSLGEPTGGYYRGGESTDAAVFCYVPPCLDLEPSVISTTSVMPICVGKELVLTASPANSRQWQRYDGADWRDHSTDEYIQVSTSGEFRLVSFGSAEGCVDTSAVFYAEFITNIPQPVITIEGSNVICVGGSVALRSSESHEYLWSNGATTRTVWLTQGGNYTVTITDINGCQATSDPVTLIDGTAVAPVATITPAGTTEICFGISQTLTANDGATAYQWSNGATSQSISVSEAGKYTVRITDTNGCQATADSAEIIVHDVRPEISYPDGLTICYDTPVTLSLAPHTGNIQWYKDGAILTGETGTTVQAGETGVYHAVLDTLGCQFAAPAITVNSNNSTIPLAAITASHPVLCEGGSVTLTAADATKYTWSTGEESQAITVNAEGTYTLKVEDAYGCTSTADFALTEVAVTIQPEIQAVSGQLDLCPGTTVTLSISAGDTWLWSNGETTQSIIVAYADTGSYSAVAYDANGCAVQADAIEVTGVEEITPIVDAGNAVICGSEPLTLMVTPVDESYTHRWSTGETAPDINVTTAGSYSVIITTAEGCQFVSAPVTVTEAAAPEKPIISSNFTITNDTIRICPNQITLVTLESTAAMAYYWNTGEETRSITLADTGKYVVAVEYATTCSAVSDTMVVMLADNFVFARSEDDRTQLCPGGSIALFIDGAEAGSTFVWNNNPAWTNDTFIATTAGAYYAEVTGTSGCVETTNTIYITDFATTKPVISANGDLNICAYDSVRLTVTAGEAYLWNTGAVTRSIYANVEDRYIVAVTDANGCVQKDSIDVTVKPVYSPVIVSAKDTICQGDKLTLSVDAPAGSSYLWNTTETTSSIVYDAPARFGTQTYWVEITYPEGCVFRSPNKNIYVNMAPRQPDITVVGSNNICPDLTVALISTKSDLYKYNWTWETSPGVWENYPDGNTFGIVIDENGNYAVTITDTITGCSNRSETLELSSLSSASVEVYPAGPVSICKAGGWVKLEAFDSQGRDVTYKWNTGETTKSIIVTQAGYYRVTVSALVEGELCEITSQRVEVRDGSTLLAPSITTSGTTTFCEGGSVTLTSSRSTTGFYEWVRWTETDTTSVGTWQQLTVTESGEYMMVFTDNKGCKVYSPSVKVTVNLTPEAIISPAGTFTVCPGEQITLSANEAPNGQTYRYIWSNGATTRVQDAAPGTHTVTVTTQAGCTKTSDPVVIRLATDKAPAPTAEDVGICEGETAILTVASAAVANPEFKWWDAATDGNLLGRGDTFETPALTADYEVWVNVSSEDLCESDRVKVTVSVGQKVAVDITTTDNMAICQFDASITLTAIPAGGTFSGNGVTGSTFDPVLSGSGQHRIYYTVTNKGCPNADSIEINVLPAPDISFSNVPATICSNEAPIIIDVYPAGGTLTGNGMNGNMFDPVEAGTGEHWIVYSIADVNCAGKDSVMVIVLQAPEPEITNTQTVVGIASGTFILTGTPVFGGDVIHTDFSGLGVVTSAGKAFFDPAIAGEGDHEITYTVTNSNGCSASTSIIISVIGKPTVDKPVVPAPVCEGDLLIVTEPDYDLHGATLVSKGWLLGGVVFDPAMTTMTYTDNNKILQYKVISGSGETISEGVRITVHAKPLLGSITALAAVCEGSKISPQVPSVTERGTPVTTQGWLLGGVAFDPATAVTYDDHGKMLQYYAASACGNDTTLAVAITVNAVRITDIADPQTVCLDTRLTITTPVVTGGATVSDAYWMFDGVRVDLATKVFGSSDEGKKLKYVVESDCGTFESNEATLQFEAKSTAPDIVMSPLNGIICSTGSVTLSTANYATYQWYKDGVAFSTNATITVDETQTGSYTVEGTSADGCQSELSAPSTVSVQAALVPVILGSISVCDDVIENYTIGGLTGNPADYIYEWTASGGTIQGSNINASVNVRWEQGGAPTLELKVVHTASKCETTVSINITVTDKPTIGIVTVPAAICEGNKITPQIPVVTEYGTPVISQGWLLDNLPFDPATTDLTYADNSSLLSYFITSACGNDTTIGVAVTVNAPPVILGIADDFTVCTGGLLTPGTVIVNDRGATRGDVYWLFDGVRVDLTTKRFTDADHGKKLKYVVESSCGNSESNEAEILIGPKPAAPSVAMTPDNGHICSTGSVTLEASDYNTYQWYRDGVAFAVTATITIDETQAGSFTVQGFTAEGCESELSEASVVTVQIPPTPGITGATVVCEGVETTYKATGLPGDATGYTYTWSITGGSIVEFDLDSVVVHWDYNVTHQLDLEVVDNSTTCVGTASFTGLTVNETPDFTVTDPDAVCPGETVDLRTTVPVNPSLTYIFYENDQETPVATPEAVRVPVAGSIYFVQATDNSTGCKSEMKMKMITVTGKPIPVVTFDVPEQGVCHGNESLPVTFYSTMAGTTYVWTNNKTGIGLAASGTSSSIPAFTVTNTSALPDTATITVLAKAGGCNGETYTFTIIANPNPVISVRDTAVCAEHTFNLAELVASNISAAYNFYQNDGVTPVDDPDAVMIAAGDTTFYVQAVTQPNGCLSTTKMIKITGFALPVFNVTNPEMLCEGTVVDLTDAIPDDNMVDYTFLDIDGTTEIADPTAVTPPAGTNTYFVQAKSKVNGCTSMQEYITVEVLAKPTLHIEAPDGTSVCDNSTVRLNAVSSYTGEMWYGWYDKNGVLNETVTTQFSPSALVADVTYTPGPTEAGTTVKLFVRARDMANNGSPVCGYIADTIFLQIHPVLTDVSLEVIDQPSGYQGICVDTMYVVKIKATEEGDLSNLQLRLHDTYASGLTIKGASVMQPYNSGVWTELTDSVVDITGTTWNLPDILQHGDSLQVQITVAAECDFYSGSPMDFYLYATDGCDNKLPVITAPTAIFYTEQDAANLNTYELFSTFSHNMVTNNTNDTVTWQLRAVVHGDQLTGEKESMVALIPQGMTVVPESYKPVQNAPDRSHITTIIDQFGVEFGLPVLSGLKEGDEIIVELKFHAIGALCGTYDFYSEIIYTDSAECRGIKCAFNSTRGGVYPTMDVERYRFSVTDASFGRTIDDLWYGDIFLKAETQFYAGDSLFFDFYVDRDNSSTLTPDDTLVRSFVHLSTLVAPSDTMDFLFDSVYIELEKQLVVVVRGNAFCETGIFPLATIMGTDTICQADTSYYHTVPGMQTYKWNVIKPDGVSGATPVRIPLEGSSEVNYVNENVARVVWPKEGDYTVWAQYSLPTSPPRELSRTYFPVRVNQIPVLELTGNSDTTVCEGTRVELSHFFRETTGSGTMSFYREESDGSLTFLSSQTPFYVTLQEGTLYWAIASSGSGCDSEGVYFGVNVNKMPQIGSISVTSLPECGTDYGSIMLTVTGGSGDYQYSIDGGATYTDLPANGLIENLTAGSYRVYVKDKLYAGCAPSVSNPVNLNPANSNLRATVQTGNAGNCTSSDGSIKLRVNGGVSPYRYQINNGSYAVLPADGVLGTSFPAGRYVINVMDADNCIATAGEVEITATSGLKMMLSQVTPSACNTNGTASITLTGGTPEYSYRLNGKGWVAMANSPEMVNLSAGLHKIFAKDADGCETSDTVRIINTTGVSVSLTGIDHATCNGMDGGNIYLSIKGDASPLTLSMDGGMTTIPVTAGADTIRGLSTGTYNVLLTDANGCTSVLEGIEISEKFNFAQAVDNRIYTYVNQSVTGNFVWDDFESDRSVQTVSSHTAPKNGNITVTKDGNYTYTPDIDFTGKDSIQYSVVNYCGFTVSAWLRITILDARTSTNRAPVAQDDDYLIKMGQSLTDSDVRKNDIDPDGDALSTPVLVSGVSGGTLTQNGNTFSYTPNAGFTGVDTFTYRICDPDGACTKAQVHITVLSDEISAGHHVALPDIYVVVENDVLTVSNTAEGVLKNDIYPQGAVPTATVIRQPDHGQLTFNAANGTFTYTPDQNYIGTDGFTYTLCSNMPATCDTARVNIFVSEACPDITPAINSVDEACIGDRVIFDTDAGYDIYQWTIASGTGGTMEGAGTTGQEHFTWSDTGTKTVSVTVTDDNGCQGSATKSILIKPRTDTGPVYRVPNKPN
ncbi:MAG: tandem-95 repeat protein [Bacteroidales bacterium]|nr:tandem-95 repeat protein [Bacteroidales bacterium]